MSRFWDTSNITNWKSITVNNLCDNKKIYVANIIWLQYNGLILFMRAV